MTTAESILWCYTDRFGLKTQIGILPFSKLIQLHNSNTISELLVGTEYVHRMHLSSSKENLEKYVVNAARCTPFKSVTVTDTVTVTRN